MAPKKGNHVPPPHDLFQMNQRLLLEREFLVEKERLSREGVGFKWLALLLAMLLYVASSLSVPGRAAVVEYLKNLKPETGSWFDTTFHPNEWRKGSVESYTNWRVFSTTVVCQAHQEPWVIIGLWSSFIPIKQCFATSTFLLSCLIVVVQGISLFAGPTLTQQHIALQRRWWEKPWCVPLSVFLPVSPVYAVGTVVAVLNAGYEHELPPEAIRFGAVVSYIACGMAAVVTSMLLDRSANHVACAPVCALALLTSHVLHSSNGSVQPILEGIASASLQAPVIRFLLHLACDLTRIGPIKDLLPHGFAVAAAVALWFSSTDTTGAV